MSEQPANDEVSSFSQEYDARSKAAASFTIYCRLCRRIFPVTFKPRPQARLRCLCGHEAPLLELDVFKSEQRARDFAGLYEKLYQAAKQALRDANLPVPPTGRFDRIRDGDDEPSGIAAVSDDNPEDRSDIASSYVGDGSDDREDTRERERELRAIVDAAPDVLARHDALSELVEHLYCVRHVAPDSLARFVAACREDMALARDVVKEATRRKREGKKVRVTFTSFKHLAIALEDEGDAAGALEACEAAIAIGLKGYDERAARLRGLVSSGETPGRAASEGDARTLPRARSRDAWEAAPADGKASAEVRALKASASAEARALKASASAEAKAPTKKSSRARRASDPAASSPDAKMKPASDAKKPVETRPVRKKSGRAAKPVAGNASEPPPLGLQSSEASIPPHPELEDLGSDELA